VSDVYSNAIINRIVSVLILWVITFFCIGHITSRKILEDSWRNLNLIFNAAPGAMVMINPQGVIELADDSLCELFGYDRDALIGQHIEMLIPEKFIQQHLQYRKDYNKRPEQRMMAARSELYARTKDGRTLPVEIGLNPIKLGLHSKVIASVVDISENKRQLEILTNYAEKLKKLTSIWKNLLMWHHMIFRSLCVWCPAILNCWPIDIRISWIRMRMNSSTMRLMVLNGCRF
tara:strand:- start:1080 stop:1775 length:696 start_codon:yes stop_codon:yes gene_type:complete